VCSSDLASPLVEHMIESMRSAARVLARRPALAAVA